MASLEMNISMKDTDLFKDVVSMLAKIVSDERIDVVVRDEYLDKMNELLECKPE